MFKGIGILLAFYVCYAAATGAVYAKSGASGKTISRQESPREFWTVIVIYAGLSIALITVF
jgi:hypothetical protein